MRDWEATDEPWFRWSYALGIRPIHPKGSTAVGMWFSVAIPSGLISIGVGDLNAVFRAMAALLFLASGIGFSATVFWMFDH